MFWFCGQRRCPRFDKRPLLSYYQSSPYGDQTIYPSCIPLSHYDVLNHLLHNFSACLLFPLIKTPSLSLTFIRSKLPRSETSHWSVTLVFGAHFPDLLIIIYFFLLLNFILREGKHCVGLHISAPASQGTLHSYHLMLPVYQRTADTHWSATVQYDQSIKDKALFF